MHRVYAGAGEFSSFCHLEQAATQALALDRLSGAHWPDLATDAALRAFEAVPFADRIAARSTYEALRIGAAQDPAAAALTFLPAADPDARALTVSYAQFIGRIMQTANFLTALGVGPNDVVSFLLPLLPQSFFTLFGAEAAGIANPVNPLLEAAQIAEILRAANTKVLVALGPAPGSDIWDKVQAIGDQLPKLKAIVVVPSGGEMPAGVHDFDTLADACPADRLIGARAIQAEDTAAYFHTGVTAVHLDKSSFFGLGGVALFMYECGCRVRCIATQLIVAPLRRIIGRRRLGFSCMNAANSAGELGRGYMYCARSFSAAAGSCKARSRAAGGRIVLCQGACSGTGCEGRYQQLQCEPSRSSHLVSSTEVIWLK